MDQVEAHERFALTCGNLYPQICTGRSMEMKEVFEHAFPVTAVKLPEGDLARRSSAMLGEALDALPMGGIPGF